MGTAQAEPPDPEPARMPVWRAGEISRRENEGVFVVTVQGELDIANIAELRESLMEIPNTALGLVVDLSATTFIDSATVGLLFELRGSLARRSQGLRVVAPTGTPAARALELMSFPAAALVQPPVADAVAAVRSEQPPRG